MSMTIKTNNVARPVLLGYELTEKEKAEFDYMDNIDEGNFFRYKGKVYDLGEFMVVRTLPDDSPLKDWDAYISDSFFSGVVIIWADSEYESVIVGTFYS